MEESRRSFSLSPPPLAAGAAIPQPYEPAGPAKNRIGLRRATQERRRETSK
jgi:hypothetical protein